jgi:Saposin-like type B, region 1
VSYICIANIYSWILYLFVSDEISQSTEDIIVILETVQSSQLCPLCEKYASDAIEYLSANKTQIEIIGALHLVCSKLDYLKQQVSLLVSRSDKVIPVVVGNMVC